MRQVEEGEFSPYDSTGFWGDLFSLSIMGSFPMVHFLASFWGHTKQQSKRLSPIDATGGDTMLNCAE